MLKVIALRNFAIVDSLEVEFHEGFSVLTGETGAGKSIVLDALNLLMGNKADIVQIKNHADQSIIQAVFDISKLFFLQKYLDENELPHEEGELLIKRVLKRNGKNKNYVGEVLVSLNQLRRIGGFLIDIYAQNSQQKLLSESIQRLWLDDYAGHQILVDQVKTAFYRWQEVRKDYEKAQQMSEKQQVLLDHLRWQNQELSNLNPQPNEWRTLSQRYDTMSHHQAIVELSHEVEELINADDGLNEKVAYISSQLNNLSKHEYRFAESLGILESIEAELSEVASNMREIYSQSSLDEEDFLALSDRLAQLNAMAKKYAVDVEALPEKYHEVKRSLLELEDHQRIEELKNRVIKAQNHYQEAALALRQSRQQAAERLSAEVICIMHQLLMPQAIFAIHFYEEEPSSYGNESVQFMVSVNPGSDLHPLSKIASGGELSRISLALQVVVSQFNRIPTLIFDEVDIGMSGQAADRVGYYLKQLSKFHQIFLVTHLPQVAAYANNHYEVSKSVKAGKTVSQMKLLNKEDRETEIARMLGGEAITALSKQHAQELLSLAK